MNSSHIISVMLVLLIIKHYTIATHAATLVSGSVSGKWTIEGSPYRVMANATVPNGSLLQIDAGVVVELGSGIELRTDGQLLAIGNQKSNIVFKAILPYERWSRLYIINNSSNPSKLLHCNIIDANTGIWLYIYGVNESMRTDIINCQFINCRDNAIYGESIPRLHHQYMGPCDRFMPCLSPNIIGNTFISSANGCVIRTGGFWHNVCGDVPAYAAPVLSGNVFIECSSVAFELKYERPNGPSKPIFRNNNIIRCNKGVLTRAPYDTTLVNNIFYHTPIAVERIGSSSGVLENNCFFGDQEPRTFLVGYSDYPLYGRAEFINRNGDPCDVAGNIFMNPLFKNDTNDYRLSNSSPCIDAGSENTMYNDVHIPPSMGTVINDMGAYGGADLVVEDADGDGLLDEWEIAYFKDIISFDGNSDPDNDQLINLEEQRAGTSPLMKDTDGDGFSDYTEIYLGTNPLSNTNKPEAILTIRHSVNVQFPTEKGKKYVIQGSDDLVNWENINHTIEGTGDIYEIYFITEGNNRRFFRAELTKE